eukprot:m.6728 g.6728  ORF g.6728 m.6728 type:complete len:358 (-) comp5185_c0_seq1:213-1286(-)
MDLVRPNVYIGDVDSPYSGLSRKNIRHVISVTTENLVGELPECVRRHLSVPVTDTEESDLLTWFPKCLDFIDVALEAEEGVLVHCHAGVSRSAAILLCFLMKREGMTPREAFKDLKKSRKSVRPNDGFVAQVKLFHEMGCCIDKSHPEYRLYKLNNLVDEHSADGRVEPAALAPDPLTSPPEGGADFIVKCKKCRRLLFTDMNLLDHEPGEGQLSFRYRKRDPASAIRCTSHFVEPMVWMQEVAEGATQGKILCCKCNGRLGSFNWAGAQCSCGAWVTPSFQVHKGRVDVQPSRMARAAVSVPARVHAPVPVLPMATADSTQTEPPQVDSIDEATNLDPQVAQLAGAVHSMTLPDNE